MEHNEYDFVLEENDEDENDPMSGVGSVVTSVRAGGRPRRSVRIQGVPRQSTPPTKRRRTVKFELGNETEEELVETLPTFRACSSWKKIESSRSAQGNGPGRGMGLHEVKFFREWQRSRPSVIEAPHSVDGLSDGQRQATIDELQYVLDDILDEGSSGSSIRSSLFSLLKICTDERKRKLIYANNLMVMVLKRCFAVSILRQESRPFVMPILAVVSADFNCSGCFEAGRVGSLTHMLSEMNEDEEEIVDGEMMRRVCDHLLLTYGDIGAAARSSQPSIELAARVVANLLTAKEQYRIEIDRDGRAIQALLHTAQRCLANKEERAHSTEFVCSILTAIEFLATRDTFRKKCFKLVELILGLLERSSEPGLVEHCLRALVNLSHEKLALDVFLKCDGTSTLMGLLDVNDDDSRKSTSVVQTDCRTLSIAFFARAAEQSPVFALDFLTRDSRKGCSALQSIIRLSGEQCYGKGMENSIIVGYVSLLVGSLWRTIPSYRDAIRSCLPQGHGPDSVADLLEEFLVFQHMLGTADDNVDRGFRAIAESLRSQK
uniref:Wings apart-like protein C-terminal domain-containing protein n=1 Tax=Compsopogon caeruleus TaxID=31354 RepID=A0A7S1T5Q6_9RHOD|mmetsp:Transcript_10546/g.21241  ORF Transcript_10546/g.21241 Transcript_10546/m.21241 type:complete len:547 (+) Transcript_10546:76-1716(+)